MMKGYIIFCAIIIFKLFAWCNVNRVGKKDEYAIDYSVHKFDTNICCCKYLTKDNSRFWSQDSIGNFGFRRIIAPLILKECDLKQFKWQEVKEYFGQPGASYTNEYIQGREAILFRYCTYLDLQSIEPLNSFKTQYFEIAFDKKDSTILKIAIRYVDG